jgi:uncharacterized protein YbjT (DUF2867 family)
LTNKYSPAEVKVVSRSAAVLGATGLVGGHCLQALLGRTEFGNVLALGRRTVELQHPKLRQKLVQLGTLTGGDAFSGITDVFCCLGTTIKKAGSQEAFRRVDHDYVVDAASAAFAQGAKQFLLVSSIGADVESRIFYSRVKGEVERDVSVIGFHAVHIFRPSFLVGDREEPRFRETIATTVSKAIPFLFAGPFRKYKPIEARTVARVMVKIALKNQAGINIHESDEIQDEYSKESGTR